MSRPLTTPASKASASTEMDEAPAAPAPTDEELDQSNWNSGEVPTDKINVMRIVHMMHGGTLASLGLDACCCCCGGGNSFPLELNLCTIGAKRGPYIKGKGLLEWCQDQAYRIPFAPTEENVIKLTEGMLKYEVLLKANKIPERKKTILPVRDPKENVPSQDPVKFKKDFYVWHYEGNPMVRNALMTLIVCVVIFFCLMPAWPRSMKVGVWYCSVTMLLIMFGFLILRNTLWLIVWICSGWNLTIFPYVLIDGIPISMVFAPWGGPIKAWGNSGSWYPDTDVSMRMYRVGTLVTCIAIGFWVWNQPTEFDDYMLASRAFTDDLYSGNLLSDMSNTDKVSGNRNRKKERVEEFCFYSFLINIDY